MMETERVSWKSGSVVRLLPGSDAMQVIGRDSVGSVICRPLNDERHPGIYVPPSLLVDAAAGPDGGISAHSITLAMEPA